MAACETSRLRVDNVSCYRNDAIVAVTLISGRFDYDADQMVIEGKDIPVRSYCRVQVAGMPTPSGRVINLNVGPGAARIAVGDVIVLKWLGT